METPSSPDNEHGFNALRLRIEKTVHFIQSVPADMFADSAGRLIELKFRTASGLVDGVAYVTTFMLPNFFFHVATAHDILRHNAMEIGKRDFLGSFEAP